MEKNYVVYQHVTPDGMYYFGQTQNVEKRWSNNGAGYKKTSLQPYIEQYGWENIKHIVLFRDQTKEDALWIEDFLITTAREDGVCINKNRSGLVSKEEGYDQQKSNNYYEQNKEQIRERIKQYREQNKDKIKEQSKQYYEENKEQIRERIKQYREQNKDKIKEQSKQYYEENKDKIKERKKQYRERNKNKISDYNRDYREQHKEELKEYRRKNRDKINEYNRQYRRRKKQESQIREFGYIHF